MIQRVQSLYLFFAVIGMALMLIFPIANLIGAGDLSYEYLFYGIVTSEDSSEVIISTIPLACLLFAIPLMSLITIFLFRNRVLQLRLCVFNIIWMIGALILTWYYTYEAGRSLDVEALFSFPAIMPLVSAILSYLAFRGIRRDELLIRSVDRIR